MKIFEKFKKAKNGLFLPLNKNIVKNFGEEDDCWRECCPECCCTRLAPCSCMCYWEVDQALPSRSNETWWGMTEGEPYYTGSGSIFGDYRGGSWYVTGVPAVSGFHSDFYQEPARCPDEGGVLRSWIDQCGPSSFAVQVVSSFPYDEQVDCNDPPWPGPPMTGDYLGNWVVKASDCTFYFPVISCGYTPSPYYPYEDIVVCTSCEYEYDAYGNLISYPPSLGIQEQNFSDPIYGPANIYDNYGNVTGTYGGPCDVVGYTQYSTPQWHPFIPTCCSYYCGGSQGGLCSNGLKEHLGCYSSGQDFEAYVTYEFTISGIQEHEKNCCGGFYAEGDGAYGGCAGATSTKYEDRPGNVNY